MLVCARQTSRDRRVAQLNISLSAQEKPGSTSSPSIDPSMPMVATLPSAR
jgi:hypothetical protein